MLSKSYEFSEEQLNTLSDAVYHYLQHLESLSVYMEETEHSQLEDTQTEIIILKKLYKALGT